MPKEKTLSSAPVHAVVTLRTECTMELWAGFFGIDVNGTQPECGHEFEIEVEVDSLETSDDGTVRPCYGVHCPKCNSLLEWPQAWELVSST